MNIANKYNTKLHKPYSDCRLFLTDRKMNAEKNEKFCEERGGVLYTKNNKATLQDVKTFLAYEGGCNTSRVDYRITIPRALTNQTTTSVFMCI